MLLAAPNLSSDGACSWSGLSTARPWSYLRSTYVLSSSTQQWTLIKDWCASRDLYSGTLVIDRAGIPLNQRLLSANIARRLQSFHDALRLASRRVSSRRVGVLCVVASLATILLCYLKRQRPWTSPLSSASPAWRPEIRLSVPQSPWPCSWGS